MNKIMHLALAGALAATSLLMAGCGNDATTASGPYAIVSMTNGTTGAEPYLVKDGAVTLIKDINPGSGSSNPIGFTPYNGKIYFSANDGTNYGLWATDGTAAGTTLVKAFQSSAVTKAVDAQISASLKTSGPSGFTVFNGKLYFSATDGINGYELWATDGATTTMVKDINPTTGSGSSPRYLTVMNGKLYFSANDGVHGRELWVTNGTDIGTTMVKDINLTAGGSSSPSDLTVWNGKIYFAADDGVNGYELWATDGTATVMVKDINTSSAGASSNPNGFTAMNGKLYFAADDGVHGTELWATDGTDTGTTMVKDINTSSAGASSYPSDEGFKVMGGKLYFAATDGVHGYELWATDGTDTFMVKDINTSSAGADSYPAGFTIFNGKLYFNADDGVHGFELWVTNGTDTSMVADIYPGSSRSGAGAVQAIADAYGLAYVYGNFTTLLLGARDADHGLELWTTDGTTSGTKLLQDLNPGTGDGISLFGMKG